MEDSKVDEDTVVPALAVNGKEEVGEASDPELEELLDGKFASFGVFELTE